MRSSGSVDCLRFDSAALGGTTAFSYFIPLGCDPAESPPPECPVLYYLHGTGGSYREGTSEAWVKALTHGPPVDPRTEAEPWQWADTGTWVEQAQPIDMILVAPHGLTLPGGYGPKADQNPFWFDWNPRYAQGGDDQRYDTPAPRFHAHLVDELVPYVDATFPTSGTREQRAIVGFSMGGIGALANGMRHPDVWASIGARSGGTFPFGAATGVAPGPSAGPGVSPPVPVPHTRLPGVVPSYAPEATWEVLYGTAATVGFGDFVADNVWWRQTQPAELVTNARARDAGGEQSVHIKYFVNDAVARRAEDLQGNPSAIYFEAILYPTNLHLDELFARHGVERTFDVGPGLHSGTYAVPYFREQLEHQYARLRHRDGSGAPPPAAARFDYRSIEPDFTIWGWHVEVDRAAVEFLYLTDVSCAGMTLRGSGAVRVTPPPACGFGGSVDVDLGPSQATDEPVTGTATSDGYGRTVTVSLDG
ncbi:MAG TPA: alpha/beta hydrolase-fold protein [Acidimicrobiales bacterium]